MPLDINDFRAEKGGNPELIRDTVRKRFKDPKIVDEIIESDVKWRQSMFKDDESRRGKSLIAIYFRISFTQKSPT